MAGLFDLHGKRVLVTGANAGIGLAFAEALADAGADLVIWARRADRNAEAARRLRDKGVNVLAQEVDISDEGAVIAAFAEAVADGQKAISTVIANAGITLKHQKVQDVTAEMLNRAIAVNQLGTVFTAREAARYLIARGQGGSIVLTGSLTSMVGYRHGALAYSMTKGAIEAGTRVMAAELGQYNIRVNCIIPGAIESELTYPQAIVDHMKTITPLGRPGKPHEMGGLAVYFASDASTYQTGSCVVIDGGQRIQK
jgi:NAD(P)-dependent dehydrogenase (short-subunit alcohol dehydrogenase family)